MKKILILALLLFTLNIWSVHNLTINGDSQATVSIGDDAEIYFEFEEVGASASFSVQISLGILPIPPIAFDSEILLDGGPMDSTPADGVFSAIIPVFASAPDAATVTITLTDNEISDSVDLEFAQIDSDYSLAGTITQDNEWGNLPVPSSLVFSLYNAAVEEVTELFAAGDFDAILGFMMNDHYLVSDLSTFLGQYQLFIPDTLEDVYCTTGVFSILDTQNSHIAPDFREDMVNGHITNLNFHYIFADGIFTATVYDSENQLLQDAIITITQEGEIIPNVINSDENGQVSIGLANGNYSIAVYDVSHQPFTEDFTISNGDYNLDVNLQPLMSIDDFEVANSVKIVTTYPNPVNNNVSFSYQLKQTPQTNPQIEIFNLKGQCVKVLKSSNIMQNGMISWDTKDKYENNISSGVYYFHLSESNRTLDTGKLIILK